MHTMKVAALIPFRNEARLLPYCLESLRGVADMVIGMDDHSTDNSGEALRKRGGIVLQMEGELSGFSMGKEKIIRQILVDEARKRGATHFFCLDADEIITVPFRRYGRELMDELKPGHKLALRWLTLWGKTNVYRDGDYSKFHGVYRGIIVRDSPDLPPYEGFLHMPRTPGSDA
ncbi:MAG: glycosyltransferase family 2 protein, partial [Mailhella sp.]